MKTTTNKNNMENQWQPIETAPTDGTKILVCHIDYYSPITARWSCYHPNKKGEETWREDGSRYIVNPTHWMPLPPKPETATT